MISIRAVLVVLALAGAARAERIALPQSKATVDVPHGWTKLETAGVAASYRGPDGQLLAVTRAQVPNPDAWRPASREAYAEQVERGALAAAPGQRRIARKLADVRGVPALDLELRRAGGATVVLRVLLFRSYSLAVAIEVPRGVGADAARAIASSLLPPR